MKQYFLSLRGLVCWAWLLLLPAFAGAQPGKNAVFGTDRDGDGIPDTGGQDKCPTTLSQIEGRRATAVDEYSGQEVTIRLPKVLKDFVFQDRIPLDEARKKLLNEQGVQKRELKRVEEKYGKYADMKASERKVKADELTAVIADFQTRIDSIAEATRQLDPNSYIEFVGNITDKEGKIVLQEQVKVKIRLRVDAFGCLPDDDRDGSPNMVDLCPNELGPMESSGCPDRDKDGTPDKEDLCPDTPGSIEAQGCPDRDGDGIPDPKDDCPDTPGLLKLNGCPDRDGDGIADPKDDCPDTPGLAELKGCPDRDKDGIRDQDDACPDQPGPLATQGCPDRDGDGVLDKNDECPTVPGPADNKGCPKILEKASRVLFETGKAIIKPVSYPLLDELVDLLREYPDAFITLEGHTDSEGTEEDNLQLSKDRAASVRQYLIDKGIDATRISSTGYGESRPIDTNATEAGRSRNRRVEMRLKATEKFD